MKRTLAITLAIALAIIPATAFAAYALDKEQGTPAKSYIIEISRVNGETRTHLVATIEKPQSRLDNLYAEYKAYQTKKELEKMKNIQVNQLPIIKG